MFARLARLVCRHWLIVLLAWTVIVVAVKYVAPTWDEVCYDGNLAYLPSRMTSARGEKLSALAFPNLASKSQVAMVIARPDGDLGPADLEVADRLAARFAPEEGKPSLVTAVWSHQDPIVGRKLMSPVGDRGQAVLVMLQLENEFMSMGNVPFLAEVYRAVDEARDAADFPEGLQLAVSGSAAIGADMIVSAQESIRNTELATVALVVIILLGVYRAPGLVIVPLAAILASLVLSMDVIALLAQWSERAGAFDFRIFRTTQIFIVVVLFGAATDYCLFLIARYREELQRGLSPHEAVEVALGQTGHALVASAMTTILGLGTMLFADFGKFRYGGPAVALSLAAALLACLTIAPALLRVGGRAIFWPFGVGTAAGNSAAPQTVIPARPSAWRQPLHGFWEKIAGAIIRRPGLIMVGSLAVLAVPAYCGLSVPITYNLLGELSADRQSVRGTQLLQQYFPVGETGPITLLAYRQGGDFDGEEGRRQISLLTKELSDLVYTDRQGAVTRPVLSVRSLTNPLGDPPASFSPFTPAGRRKMAALKNPRTRASYLSEAPGYSGEVTRFDLVCRYDPFSAESIELLDAIESRLLAKSDDASSPWHGVSFDFAGITAGIRDLEAVNASDCLRIGAMASIAVLAVLVVLLRRTVLSLFLILTVLLGYFVTLGITETVFAWLYADTFNGLDWTLPLFLFVILVAVGEDYNIYLVTRVSEEQRRRGLLEGLRVAVVQTGGIITSCGVIMAGTFASMLTGTLRGMHELGFALSIGVLLDTFIIRTIVVPAFMALWARWFPERAVPAPAASDPNRHIDAAHEIPDTHWRPRDTEIPRDAPRKSVA